MHLLVALRVLLRCVRASLHAALVVSLSVALFLLFLLWSVMQLVDEREVTSTASGERPSKLSTAELRTKYRI
jgi:hypothetical protein